MLSSYLRSFGLSVFVLALAACGPTTPEATPEVTSEATPEVTRETIITEEANFCDAYWLINVYVWLDENANGIRDEGEEPLPGVRVQAVDGGSVVHAATSDAKGVATLESMIPCEAGAFVVYAEVPPGHRLTTEPRVQSPWTALGDVQFGIVRDDSTATPTP